MFKLVWVVHKYFSCDATWVYFCRQNRHLLDIAGVLSIDPNTCGSHTDSRGVHALNLKL